MKLVCYLKETHEQLAFLVNDTLYDTDAVHPELPSTMSMLLNYWEDYFPLAKAINESLVQGKISFNKGVPLVSAKIISPVPIPTAIVNAPAVITNDSPNPLPDYYFTGHHNVQGIGEVKCMPDYLVKPDFEMGIAIVICKHGRNIKAADAGQHIGGYMIRNSIYAMNWGNGKNFATVLGPWLVTPDELEPFRVPAKEGHSGNAYNLAMNCRVNGEQAIESNMADMLFTFEEVLESYSYGANVQPGDIIGIGTGEAGYFCNLNNSGKRNDPNYTTQWLRVGDVIEIEVEGLGISTSTILEEESEILADDQ